MSSSQRSFSAVKQSGEGAARMLQGRAARRFGAAERSRVTAVNSHHHVLGTLAPVGAKRLQQGDRCHEFVCGTPTPCSQCPVGKCGREELLRGPGTYAFLDRVRPQVYDLVEVSTASAMGADQQFVCSRSRLNEITGQLLEDLTHRAFASRVGIHLETVANKLQGVSCLLDTARTQPIPAEKRGVAQRDLRRAWDLLTHLTRTP